MKDKFSNITLEEMRSGRFQRVDGRILNDVTLIHDITNMLLRRVPDTKYVWVMSNKFAEKVCKYIDFPYAFRNNDKLIMLYEIPVVIVDNIACEIENVCAIIMYPYLWLKEVDDNDIDEIMEMNCLGIMKSFDDCVGIYLEKILKNGAIKSLYNKICNLAPNDDNEFFETLVLAHISHLL